MKFLFSATTSMFLLLPWHSSSAEIVAAEYYLNVDPGPGLGVPIAPLPAAAEVDLSVELPTETLQALPLGTHSLTVRFQDNQGDWSIALTRIFEKIAEDPVRPGVITAAEYYLNQDPGPGNGTPIPIPSAGAELDFSVEVPPGVIAALPSGSHSLTVRTRNQNGAWSVALSRLFEKDDRPLAPAGLAAAIEYRWYLGGSPVGEPVVLAASEAAPEIVFDALASVAGLTEGLTYQLVATPLDSLGNRGISETRQVLIQISDADGDGLPDPWELANGLDDPDADDDQDGLSNRQEWAAGTNPKAADTSGDGISDKLALDLGFNPLQRYPAISATLAELRKEGEPTAEQVRALYPGTPILSRNPQTGKFDLRIGLQQSTDLGFWQKLPMQATDSRFENGDMIFSFQASDPTRFFRVAADE